MEQMPFSKDSVLNLISEVLGNLERLEEYLRTTRKVLLERSEELGLDIDSL